ncbi:hypothetical protein NIES2101_25780 [Calothrix sp. HK-06]|nr:hypothetical protein NIES2101_25780 [Calothrix sp. HK-06]
MPDQEFRANVPEVDPTEIEDSRTAAAIASEHRSFLEKVMVGSGFGDLYDARDFSEIVFRVMRDLMTTDAQERVEAELHNPALETEDKSLKMEVADLWKDTNPIVGFLSRIRKPLRGPAPIGIDSNLFLTRIANEGGLPGTVDPEQAVKAVFSATKDELSSERIQEIAGWLPDDVRKLWEQA